jgi:threonylcarbamoyladenosine tRNA methylthiotransferase MtaB
MEHKIRIAFHTLGCKLNFSETSFLSRSFDAEHYEIVDFKEKADVYVINTCLVTERAEKKSWAFIRAAKRRNPNAIVAAVGCFSEVKKQEVLDISEVDVVLGSSDKFILPEKINELLGVPEKFHFINKSENDFQILYSLGDRTRSFFKIQDGCDYFCTYCAVPFARGRSRSDTIENTLLSAREIAAAGIKEIILTGVNIGDFGRKNGESFYELLAALDKEESLERIRISSVEPNLLTDEIIELVAKSKKLQPHFHIPLQAGSDAVLKAMKRRYNTALFSERVNKIKQLMPHCCIAVDVIAGFPGESDDDFSTTYQLIENLGISYMHVFTYSEREGTIAAQSHDVIPHAIRTRRSKELMSLSEKKKTQFYLQNVGSTRNVLFESDNDMGAMYGFTDNYIKVKTQFNEKYINKIIPVRLSDLEKDGIFAVVINE